MISTRTDPRQAAACSEREEVLTERPKQRQAQGQCDGKAPKVIPIIIVCGKSVSHTNIHYLASCIRVHTKSLPSI
jgi:hypothetical protein